MAGRRILRAAQMGQGCIVLAVAATLQSRVVVLTLLSWRLRPMPSPPVPGPALAEAELRSDLIQRASGRLPPRAAAHR